MRRNSSFCCGNWKMNVKKELRAKTERALNILSPNLFKIFLLVLPLIIVYLSYKTFIVAAFAAGYEVRIDAVNLFLFLKFYEFSGFPLEDYGGVGDFGHFCSHFESYDRYYSFLRLYREHFIAQFALVAAVLALLVSSLFIAWFRLLRGLLSPMRSITGLNLKKISDPQIESLVREISEEFNIGIPKIVSTQEPLGNVISARFYGKTWIVIPEIVRRSLSLDEIRTVLAHEAWHIKRDLEAVTRFVAARHFSGRLLKVALFITIAITYVLYFIVGLPAAILYVDAMGLLIVPLAFFVCEALLGVVKTSNPKFREYEADFMASLHTGKPALLISAIRKLVLLNVLSTGILRSRKLLCAVDPRTEKSDLEQRLSWDRMLKRSLPWKDEDGTSTAARIKLLRVIDKAMHDSLRVLPGRNRKPRIIFPRYFVEEAFAGMNRRLRESIMNEILSSRDINVRNIAGRVRCSVRNVLIVFYIMLLRGCIVPAD